MINLNLNLSNLSLQETSELLPDNLILLGYRGSHAHGTFIPSSDPKSIDDIDLLGVFVAPIEHYLGFGRRETYDTFVKEWDAVSYELRKFIQMLLNSNPNVITFLWNDESDFLHKDYVGEILRENRNLFVSKKAYKSFQGYAHGEVKKMLRYTPEVRSELELRRKHLESFGIFFLNDKPQLGEGAPQSIVELVKQYEELYGKYFGGFKGYKRKKLIEQYGYDTKDASHLIRLLRMGCEFMQTGEFQVKRTTDAQELMDIKTGGWPLAEVQEEADRLFEVFEAFKERSTLPDEPDRERAESLCVELICLYHGIEIEGPVYEETPIL